MTANLKVHNQSLPHTAANAVATLEEEKATAYGAMTASGKELFDITFGMPDDPGTPLTLDEINRELTAQRAGATPHG